MGSDEVYAVDGWPILCDDAPGVSDLSCIHGSVTVY